MKYIKSFFEKLGIPDNITNVARQIFDDVINDEMFSSPEYEMRDLSEGLILRGNYKIADLTIYAVIVRFQFYSGRCCEFNRN